MIHASGIKTVPEKLKQDAIVEALLEIRFDSQTIPEILLGRLADHSAWNNFHQRRLPISEIPAVVRQSDRNLRYSPWLELADLERNRKVRIGEHVLSYHQLAPYPGWQVFRGQLFETIDGLFSKAGKANIRRLGLRYINGLKPAVHRVDGILDLNMTVSVAGQSIPESSNVNFTTNVHDDTDCTVRIAAADFVTGSLPEGTAVVIDVDVFTKPSARIKSAEDAKAWLEVAHTREKEQFFRLLKPNTVQELMEK